VVPADSVVDLSRIQFGLTAIYHFLFAPLTLGLSWLLVVMESLYLFTKKQVYKDMTQFWGKLFAINFAMGVVTGITLEFEFGQNWAYFSRYIGDAFGPALAIEGITAFMLEATMIGVFFFAWDKIPRWLHCLATFLLAVGSNLSIVNILVANSWMQHPVATLFDWKTMSMQLTSIWGLYNSYLAQIRIGHVLFAGAMTGTMFMFGISAYYLLKRQDTSFAVRSMAVAIGFGIVSVLSVGWFGDSNGIAVSKTEPEKMAAIEAVWSTPKAPAAWSMIAWPDQKQEKNLFDVRIPYGLSLIATHSLTGTVEGAKQIINRNKVRIANGVKAYGALEKLRAGKATAADRAVFNRYRNDIGFGFLVKRYHPAVVGATPAQIDQAAKSTIPDVFTCFWAFRIMVFAWLCMLCVLFWGLYLFMRRRLHNTRLFHWAAILCLPMPWIASEFGWVTAEIGRQPWVVHGFLPTYLGVSSIDTASVAFSLGGFALLYTGLLVVELFLMFKYGRLGPSSLGKGKYHFEKLNKSAKGEA